MGRGLGSSKLPMDCCKEKVRVACVKSESSLPWYEMHSKNHHHTSSHRYFNRTVKIISSSYKSEKPIDFREGQVIELDHDETVLLAC